MHHLQVALSATVFRESYRFRELGIKQDSSEIINTLPGFVVCLTDRFDAIQY